MVESKFRDTCFQCSIQANLRFYSYCICEDSFVNPPSLMNSTTVQFLFQLCSIHFQQSPNFKRCCIRSSVKTVFKSQLVSAQLHSPKMQIDKTYKQICFQIWLNNSTSNMGSDQLFSIVANRWRRERGSMQKYARMIMK